MLSGSDDFDRLRDAFAADPALRQELEMYSRIVLDNFNPTGRAARFVFGALNEWGVALAAFSAGVFALPDGHDADSTDLRGVIDQQRTLWSVKASADGREKYDFILQNFRTGDDPPAYKMPATLFMHPRLPGLTIVLPELHGSVVSAISVKRDCRVLQLSVLQQHAADRPECVVEYQQPANPGGGDQDEVTGLDLVRGIVDSIHFNRLRRPFQDADRAARGDIVDRLRELQRMKDKGHLTTSQAELALSQLLGDKARGD